MTLKEAGLPLNPEIPATEVNDVEEKGAGTGSDGLNIDLAAQFQNDLAAEKAKVEEWHDRFLRKAAEFENYRKRTDKEKAEAVILAKSSILTEFLPVADACERALASIESASDAPGGLEQYQAGVELLYRQLIDILSRVGVVPIEAEGKAFDPHLHEAMMREVASELEENTIVRVMRKGYMYKDRLMRPAQVSVAACPPDAEKSDTQNGSYAQE
jgi:molecular chaperone GrpE